MKVIDPGHAYTMHSYDGTFPQSITFMKRKGEGYPGNYDSHPGTNCQEVLRVLIDRVKYLDEQIPSEYNISIIDHLRMALWQFELRAATRHGLRVPKNMRRILNVEDVPSCKTCGHIYCHHGI
jgi:hypothetical protein